MTLKLSQCTITKILISPKLVPNETSSLELVSRYKLQTEESVLLLGLTSGILESTLKNANNYCKLLPMAIAIFGVECHDIEGVLSTFGTCTWLCSFSLASHFGQTTPSRDNKYPELATSVNHIHHPTNMQAT
jgi:hypothetical protein